MLKKNDQASTVSCSSPSPAMSPKHRPRRCSRPRGPEPHRRHRTSVLAAAAVASLVCLFAGAAWAKKPPGAGGKGGGNTPPLMAVLITDDPDVVPAPAIHSDAVTPDDDAIYVDGRATGGDDGVEAFLFPSGNLGLRLEGSTRTIELD